MIQVIAPFVIIAVYDAVHAKLTEKPKPSDDDGEKEKDDEYRP